MSYNPLLDEDARIPVTRVTFEPLSDGQVRWSVWDGDKLRHIRTISAGDQDAMRKALNMTRILVEGISRIPRPTMLEPMLPENPND